MHYFTAAKSEFYVRLICSGRRGCATTHLRQQPPRSPLSTTLPSPIHAMLPKFHTRNWAELVLGLGGYVNPSRPRTVVIAHGAEHPIVISNSP